MRVFIPLITGFVVAMVLQPAQAQQGILFNPSILFYSYEDKDSGGVVAKVDAQYVDVKLGLIVSNGIYLGGLYSQMKREDGNIDRERSLYGLGGGWVYSRFYIMAHMILSSDFEISTSDKLSKGRGLQFDLGYWFYVTGSLYAGPQIVHREIDYDKKNGTGVQGTKSEETVPYLSVAFIF